MCWPALAGDVFDKLRLKQPGDLEVAFAGGGYEGIEALVFVVPIGDRLL
jgi:hypothetical protein